MPGPHLPIRGGNGKIFETEVYPAAPEQEQQQPKWYQTQLGASVVAAIVPTLFALAGVALLGWFSVRATAAKVEQHDVELVAIQQADKERARDDVARAVKQADTDAKTVTRVEALVERIDELVRRIERLEEKR